MQNMTLPRSDLLLAMLQSLLGSRTESMSEYFFWTSLHQRGTHRILGNAIFWKIQ